MSQRGSASRQTRGLLLLGPLMRAESFPSNAFYHFEPLQFKQFAA
jgi:hypothetical protein